ncbi:unnamed protein product [Phaeothamnion confervicola]
MYEFRTAKSIHAMRPPVAHVEEDERFDETGTAVALLGLGVMASQLKCEAAVESLGVVGGWAGRVYLFTDKPQCFDVASMRLSSGTDLRLVDIDDGRDYSAGFALPSLGATKGNRLRAKLLKSRIFKEITDKTIQQVLYMDCDIVVAQTGCVRPMLSAAFGGWRDDEDIRFRVLSPGGVRRQFDHPERFRIHAGFFAARRDRSWRALEAWEAELSTLKYAHDRLAFLAAKKRVREHAVATGDATDDFMRVGTWKGEWERFADVRRELSCVVHVSHKRCFWQGRANIQTIIERLNLTVHAAHGGAPYCESVWTYPFTLSWLPYKSCRKIETLLLPRPSSPVPAQPASPPLLLD